MILSTVLIHRRMKSLNLTHQQTDAPTNFRQSHFFHNVSQSFKMLHVAKSYIIEKFKKIAFLLYICNERSKAWESPSIFDIHTTSGTQCYITYCSGGNKNGFKWPFS